MTDLPPPGWYDDPTGPDQERWWDGEQWSEQTRRKASQDYQYRPGELRPVGEFLGHAFTLIRRRWDDFLLVTVIGSLALAVLSVALIRPIIDAIEINNNEFSGFGSNQVGLLVAFGIGFLVVSVALSLSQYRIAWSAAIEEKLGWATAFQYGLANFLRFAGWMILAAAPIVLATAVVVGLAIAVEAAALLLFLLAIGIAYWAVVISFVPVAIVAQPRGTNPISASLATVRRRWWRIFGRGLVLGLIAGLVVQVVSAILGQLVGSNFFGLEFVADSAGNIDLVKELGNPLNFFLGSFVFLFMSYVGNIATFCGTTSIAYDVMPGPAGGAIGDEMNRAIES